MKTKLCHYDPKRKCIVIRVSEVEKYEIYKNRLDSPAACLDWIHKVHEKKWGSAVMEDFLEVLYKTIPWTFWVERS